jgi:hypothetical protein
MTPQAALGAFAAAVATADVEVTPLAEGSGVLLHRGSMRSRTVNPSGMILIGAMLAGFTELEALAERLVAAYGIDRATARRDVEDLAVSLGSLLAPPGDQPTD